jgi:hypothetical protein
LTKINIVDKFGQVVCCPLPRATPVTPPTHPNFHDLPHPCLSDQLCPNLLAADQTLNTVFRGSDWPDATIKDTDDPIASQGRISPFIQITPSINQKARINANFLLRDNDAKGNPTAWRTCAEWENPIFGCE